MDIYSLAFSVSNLGPKSYLKLLKLFGSAEAAWFGGRQDYESAGIRLKTFEVFDNFRRSFSIDEYVGRLEVSGVLYVSYQDERYSEKLKELENPPIGLFCKGNIDLLHAEFSIAAVGTRKITSYGRSVTESIVESLVNCGACIISGLALGVDGIAHRTAVLSKGDTIAVLACGVNCCLPSENYNLYSDILKNNGLIISEYPLSQPPNKGTFLARNRIVAALSDGVLITEAAEDSGSLVTADWGLQLGKKVFAVPGPITSRMSDGSLKLLKSGAVLVSSGEDILQEFKIQNSNGKISNQKLINLNPKEKMIVTMLENESLGIDELSRVTKIPVVELFGFLSNLEIGGVLKNSNGRIELT